MAHTKILIATMHQACESAISVSESLLLKENPYHQLYCSSTVLEFTVLGMQCQPGKAAATRNFLGRADGAGALFGRIQVDFDVLP
jgi:hypothetical protein